MITTTKTADNLLDKAAKSANQAADQAIRSTQESASKAIDGAADAVDELRQDAAPLLNRAAEKASALAHRGVDAVLESSQQMRDRARQAGDATVGYIKDEPVKSILIAAATGAALMALLTLLSRNRSHD